MSSKLTLRVEGLTNWLAPHYMFRFHGCSLLTLLRCSKDVHVKQLLQTSIVEWQLEVISVMVLYLSSGGQGGMALHQDIVSITSLHVI